MQLKDAHSPRSILESTLGLLRQDLAQNQCNEQELGELVAVALATGHPEVATQALDLCLRLGRLVPLPEPDRLNRSYPPLTGDEAPERTLWASLPSHRRLAMEGRFREAVCSARTEQQLEEVAETLAHMRDFDGAWLAAHEHLSSGYRRLGPLLVMAVELYRVGAESEASWIYSMLLERFDSPVMRLRVALGWCGLRPWEGYPYMDW